MLIRALGACADPFALQMQYYLSGRTALHFAAVNGHVRCITLLVADFVPNAPFEAVNTQIKGERGGSSIVRKRNDQRCVLLTPEQPFAPAGSDLDLNGEVGRPSPEVNTIAPNSVHPKPEWTAGGIVLLIGKHSERTHRENFRKHFLVSSVQSCKSVQYPHGRVEDTYYHDHDHVPSRAVPCRDETDDGGGAREPPCSLSLNKEMECQALNTIPIVTLSKFVNKAADGGNTALHMAALNGHFDCMIFFFHGELITGRWLVLDVARMWGRHWLEPLLAPNSDTTIPRFPPSNYLSLPLSSILNIARECGLQSPTISSDDADTCAVCLERPCSVAAEGVHSIFAQRAVFRPISWLHRGLFHARSVDTAFSRLSNCPVPQQKKLSYIHPLAFVPHACFILSIRIAHHRLQKSERIVLYRFLRIFSVRLPVVHFLPLPFHCAPAMIVPAPRWNPERRKHEMNLQGVRKLHRVKEQEWREEAVQTCSGAEGAAAESIDATRR
ncbi:E3 ubiquitin-protein ligase XBAT33 [Hibiscus syriacus]|uniref:E3 ubiquitin-protein ligase XBAT33 n=1 Tax=Hibiscus syriacus TaxID=106335 RepID=A0A6A2WS68_HIBSY|nr:E3 ubiquitin-protein ligase XBAT33 [Hibiscus syriacus]